ncbi:T9SS type A sorting domain-containing protein [Flavobacterium sangjuense]|nr:T9SS type A sorting domain-containing protein [Flavobacterium sangjuense]
MKKNIYTLVAFLTITLCSAQSTVLQAEYFWDTDPGYGLGTPVLATDGNFNSAFEQLSKTGIVLPPVGLHVFNIRIRDNVNGWGPVFRNVISVQTTLGTSDFDLQHVVLYPNPVKEVLTIAGSTKINAVSMYNFLGQEVLAKNLNYNEGTIDVSNLSPGTYLVKVTADDVVKTLKVIKE